jgi:hypothetical protein
MAILVTQPLSKPENSRILRSFHTISLARKIRVTAMSMKIAMPIVAVGVK